MGTDVTIMYGSSKVPVYSVLLNKKHFHPIGGHFLIVIMYQSAITPPNLERLKAWRKWPPIGFYFILLNNTEDTGTSDGPYRVVTSVVMA